MSHSIWKPNIRAVNVAVWILGDQVRVIDSQHDLKERGRGGKAVVMLCLVLIVPQEPKSNSNVGKKLVIM